MADRDRNLAIPSNEPSGSGFRRDPALTPAAPATPGASARPQTWNSQRPPPTSEVSATTWNSRSHMTAGAEVSLAN